MINEEQKDNMLHALGRPILRKNWKPKTIFEKCYRNKFIIKNNNKSWEDLITKGFAKKLIQNNTPLLDKDDAMYYVTIEGFEKLISQFKG